MQLAIKAAMEHEQCMLDNPRKSTRTVTPIAIPAKDPDRKPN